MLCLSRRILHVLFKKRRTERVSWNTASYKDSAFLSLGFLCKLCWREKAEKSYCSLVQTWTELYNWRLSGLYSLQWPQLCCVSLITNKKHETKLPFWKAVLTCSADAPFKCLLRVHLQIHMKLLPLLKKVFLSQHIWALNNLRHYSQHLHSPCSPYN